MSATSESGQHHTLLLQRCRRVHGAVVAATWALAAGWILIDPLTGTHSSPTQRWMENIALLLVAGACTTLIAWLIQSLVIQPRNTSERAFELGYYAGRADALSESRPSLGLVTPLSDRHGRTGT